MTQFPKQPLAIAETVLVHIRSLSSVYTDTAASMQR